MTTDSERILLRDIAQPSLRTAAGDISTVAGVANLRGAIVRRLVAMPGSVVHRPAYGAGLPEFVNRRGTPANRQAVVNRTKQHLAKERRISKVIEISVGEWADGKIDLTVRVQALGSVQEFPITIGGA